MHNTPPITNPTQEKVPIKEEEEEENVKQFLSLGGRK